MFVRDQRGVGRVDDDAVLQTDCGNQVVLRTANNRSLCVDDDRPAVNRIPIVVRAAQTGERSVEEVLEVFSAVFPNVQMAFTLPSDEEEAEAS